MILFKKIWNQNYIKYIDTIDVFVFVSHQTREKFSSLSVINSECQLKKSSEVSNPLWEGMVYKDFRLQTSREFFHFSFKGPLPSKPIRQQYNQSESREKGRERD